MDLQGKQTRDGSWEVLSMEFSSLSLLEIRNGNENKNNNEIGNVGWIIFEYKKRLHYVTYIM
jgi:hypothetical protein